ncbi:Uncharacterised protein [Mycobacteroides abscessus subsp. bolletii]|uniref:hypothetical protein n=1 Tax=Mycobacteroides abscessus TaxID=36809 RepID=UPI0009A884F4|nr:hypothetical protein [Mycobacteroides abscessus]MDO3067632.1 hypothetical protein [Mycobacteroides abscessus subsp. bolletii]SKO13629.1 Uncharacterised protein [Mycobacteroides abscessus subsp. bolletii]SKX38077.1 Uncharacterised protein [Mycobacteroides abscessus subsp. bolletii]SLF99173.1 Uncharacterised protein [Mycobacteroides abscessus subsp. bolletii]
MLDRSTGTVDGLELSFFGLVPGAFLVGEVHRSFVLERFGVNVWAPASRTGLPRAVFLEAQRGDIAAHRLTKALPISLPTLIFRRQYEGRIKIAESFVRIEIHSHERKLGPVRVEPVAWAHP